MKKEQEQWQSPNNTLVLHLIISVNKYILNGTTVHLKDKDCQPSENNLAI